MHQMFYGPSQTPAGGNQPIWHLPQLTIQTKPQRQTTRKLKTVRGHVMPPYISTSLTSIRIFCRILVLCLWYNFAQNITGSSKCIQHSREVKEIRCWHRIMGQTLGQWDIVKT